MGRALTNERQASSLASEPYTRCKPSGGPRQFMLPYGLEIVDLPEFQRIYIFNISNAYSFRTVYTDGRPHPTNHTPSYFSHSVGRWEGDTLVIDTVGFSENFCFTHHGLWVQNAREVQAGPFDRFTLDDSGEPPRAVTTRRTSSRSRRRSGQNREP